MSDSLWPNELQHGRPPCQSPTSGVYSDSFPLSRWCHPTISFSVVPFSYRLQFFPYQFGWVQLLSHVQLFATPWITARQAPCPSPTPGVHSNSRPWGRWCHPAISSSVIPFSCPQSLPASESIPMSQLFAWGGQSTGVSALASFLPKKSQGWVKLLVLIEVTR